MAITFISHTEVGIGGTASITLSSIPSTYDDLLIYTSIRTNRTGQTNDPILMQVNGSSATIYSRIELLGNNGAISRTVGGNATSFSSIQATGAASVTNAFGSAWIYIPNYKSTAYNKQIIFDGVAENNTTTSQFQALMAGLIRSTSAISSISFTPGTGPTILQNSSVTLYGITKA